MDDIYSDIGTDTDYHWTDPEEEPGREAKKQSKTAGHVSISEQGRIGQVEIAGVVSMAAVTAVAYSVWW